MNHYMTTSAPGAMSLVLVLLLAGGFPLNAVYAASLHNSTYISCTSKENSALAQVAEDDSNGRSDRVRSWFVNWLFAENKNPIKSKVDFVWRPSQKGNQRIKIITTEKPHNLISLRSKTKESLIVASSASSPITTESWLFTLNFNLETVIATRVQSNLAGVKGEVLSYQCSFEDIDPSLEAGTPLDQVS